MQVKSNQVPIRCDCEALQCERDGTHRAGCCNGHATSKVHAFGLAANLCDACRYSWEQTCPEATFVALAEPIKAVELKTPKGKTFPRAARVHGPTAGECSVCAEMKVGA